MLSSICLLVFHLPMAMLRVYRLNEKHDGKHERASYIASSCNNNNSIQFNSLLFMC
jgi:hypothetical protein